MTDDTGNDTAAPRRRVWPRLLLAASLTLNVLVLSIVAGAHLRDDPDGRFGHDGRRMPSRDRAMLRQGGFMPFFEAMPPAARKRLGEALREDDNAMPPDRAELAAGLREFVEALRADPFAPDALAAVLAAQHRRAEAQMRAGRTILVDQIAQMSAAERAGFADALEAQFRDALARAPHRPAAGRPPGD